MKGRVLRLRQLSGEEEQAWADLAERAVEPNPFHEPSCVIAAARHQEFGDEIELVVAEEEGRFFACLPLRHIRTRWHRLSYQTATTRVRRMNYLGTPLIDPRKGPEAMCALLETVVEECRTAGSLSAEIWDVSAGGPVDGYLMDASAELGLPMAVTYAFERGILRRKQLDELVVAHSARTLRGLRSKQRGLGRALGGEVAVVDRSDDEAIDEYIRLEASGYKADIGVAMTTVPGEPQYFTEMCQRFARQGRLHLISLTVGSTVPAMMAWMRAGDSIFQFKWSYDAEYAKFSPGLQLHMAGIEHFRTATDAELLDTCTGAHNELVFGIYPDRRTLNRYTLVADRRLRDRLIAGVVGDGRGMRTRFAERAFPARATRPAAGHKAAGA